MEMQFIEKMSLASVDLRKEIELTNARIEEIKLFVERRKFLHH